MKFTLTTILTVLFHVIKCYDSESIESYNGIEVSPFYDAIIFSDIADIVNEFENNNIPITNLVKNESESDEDVDDLLTEYQNYLEKAHTQTKSYIEKSKLKNKVPLLRHDKYSKNNIASGKKHDDYIYKTDYFTPDMYKLPKANNALDLFLPLNNKGKLFTINEHLPRPNYLINNKLNSFNDIVVSDDKGPNSLSKGPNKSSCYCKNNQLPCTCGCKQCLLKIDTPTFNHIGPKPYKPLEDDKKVFNDNIFPFNNLQDQPYGDGKLANFQDDTLNIRIKVDVQLPSALERRITKNQVHDNANVDGVMRDYYPTVKVPSPYFNFPIPMNAFGYKKTSKTDTSPFHKISIHKKKRTKSNNSNKKHRKKIITFHNIKIEPQQLFEAEFGKPNANVISKNITYSMNVTSGSLPTASPPIIRTNVKTEKTLLNAQNETHKGEKMFLLVNISNSAVNRTDDIKADNSIETDYTNTIVNTTDETVHLLKKREAPNNKDTSTTAKSELNTMTSKVSKLEFSTQQSNTIKFESSTKMAKNATNAIKFGKDKKGLMFLKRMDTSMPKGMPSDGELLYWPVNNNNESLPEDENKNITMIILEHEHKKAKINMTNETLRNNHTRVLEKVIFGDVDWNDIDAVAPAFISFVGKYIKGALTFCNEQICHSMKCAHEKCIYRVCKPDGRLNRKGHCNGRNSTDNITTMESIMDLPSNLAFEIVDILEERMVGKLFGKVTLCINSKCITFGASKKSILKSRCIVKELNMNGHCKTTKEAKVN